MWDEIEIADPDLARLHVGISEDDWAAREDDYVAKLRQAHALVLDYVSQRQDNDDWVEEMLTWDADSAPAAVQAAILRQFADLTRFRGDDDESRVDGGFLSPRVRQLLTLHHDPPLA